MHASIRLSAAALALLLIAGCGDSSRTSAQKAAATATASPKAALKVTTTLDGRKRVPPRFRWLAHPSAPADKVEQVDFLIDGKVYGIEHDDPYNFGSDDFHGHLGWLVTSWLKPGPHRFTARAKLVDGRTASDTVIARVGHAPAPPASLAKTRWTRKVTKAAIQHAGAEMPAGRWQLIFDRAGVWELDPADSGVAEHPVFHGDRMNIDAALWMIPYTNGHGHLNRYGHKDFGAGWREDGPPARYRWSVSGDTLTLKALHETSATRRTLFQGTWTRKG